MLNLTDWQHKNDNSHIADGHEKIHRYLHSAVPLSYNQKRALKHFTDNSGHINRALYRDEDVKSHESVKQHLDSLTSQPTKHEHHVYTGVDDKGANALEKGGIVHLKGYTSTSIDKTVARAFANSKESDTMLHIHMKSGDKIHHVHPMDTWAPDEREGILSRNTKLKVHPEPDYIKHPTGRIYRLFHATIHSQE